MPFDDEVSHCITLINAIAQCTEGETADKNAALERISACLADALSELA